MAIVPHVLKSLFRSLHLPVVIRGWLFNFECFNILKRLKPSHIAHPREIYVERLNAWKLMQTSSLLPLGLVLWHR
jgi:hypothetical protein